MIFAVLRTVDQRADDVGGQQVGRELDAMEGGLDRGRQGADGQGLGQAGHAFEQDVAVGQQPDQQPVHQLLLADDDPANLRAQPANPAGGRLHLLVQRCAHDSMNLGDGCAVTQVICKRFNSASSPSPHRPTPVRGAGCERAARRVASVMLRRGFDGASMGLRRGFEGLQGFSPLVVRSLLPARFRPGDRALSAPAAAGAGTRARRPGPGRSWRRSQIPAPWERRAGCWPAPCRGRSRRPGRDPSC